MWSSKPQQAIQRAATDDLRETTRRMLGTFEAASTEHEQCRAARVFSPGSSRGRCVRRSTRSGHKRPHQTVVKPSTITAQRTDGKVADFDSRA